nr:MAG TPA: hypothetical protein [Caudoviricetes sp.]
MRDYPRRACQLKTAAVEWHGRKAPCPETNPIIRGGVTI